MKNVLLSSVVSVCFSTSAIADVVRALDTLYGTCMGENSPNEILRGFAPSIGWPEMPDGMLSAMAPPAAVLELTGWIADDGGDPLFSFLVAVWGIPEPEFGWTEGCQLYFRDVGGEAFQSGLVTETLAEEVGRDDRLGTRRVNFTVPEFNGLVSLTYPALPGRTGVSVSVVRGALSKSD